MDKLWNAAKENKQRIVLPEGDEERTIIATEKIQKLGLAFPILVGNEEKILEKAKELGVDLTGVEIINPEKSDRLQDYINEFYESRKNKGMTLEKADKIVRDPLYFGTIPPKYLLHIAIVLFNKFPKSFDKSKLYLSTNSSGENTPSVETGISLSRK